MPEVYTVRRGEVQRHKGGWQKITDKLDDLRSAGADKSVECPCGTTPDSLRPIFADWWWAWQASSLGSSASFLIELNGEDMRRGVGGCEAGSSSGRRLRQRRAGNRSQAPYGTSPA
jgi:hypothetical protein